MKQKTKGVRATGRRGRPRVHAEPWTKVSVVLLNRQIVGLDRLVADIRAQNRTALNRAGIVRALIDGLLDRAVKTPLIGSEAELQQWVAKRFRAPPQRRL